MSEVQILSPRPRRPGDGTGANQGGRRAVALARIYRPAKSAMQSGRALAKKWILEYEPAGRRDPDPLMGWSSARDTLNEVRLRFETEEEAVAFAKREGRDYTLIDPQTRTPTAVIC